MNIETAGPLTSVYLQMTETAIHPGLTPLRAWEVNKAALDTPMGVRVELPKDVAQNVIALQEHVYDINNVLPDNFSASAFMTRTTWNSEHPSPIDPNTYHYTLPDRDLPWLTPGNMYGILGNIAAGLTINNLLHTFVAVKSTGVSVAVDRCISYFPSHERNSLVFTGIKELMRSFSKWNKQDKRYDDAHLVQLQPNTNSTM